ncbi:tyrosine phosphatase family-domain-containing protein [Phlyctochytrium arcticum]|nr:tyrosine phosphatase family-domain-containing protein [Phlyctochytrium arcticum]
MSRLPPVYPPFRYGIVEEDLHRGAYPKERNFRFLRRLRLKTILSLIPEPPNADLAEFCASENISSIHVRVDKPKEHVPLSFQKTSHILTLLADPNNHPIFVHCLDGAGVTGAAVMCLRKLQCWTMASILIESTRYHKEGVIGSEEAEFVEKFAADVELPARIPKWLWGGHVGFKKHPSLRLKIPTQSTSQGKSASQSAIGSAHESAASHPSSLTPINTDANYLAVNDNHLASDVNLSSPSINTSVQSSSLMHSPFTSEDSQSLFTGSSEIRIPRRSIPGSASTSIFGSFASVPTATAASSSPYTTIPASTTASGSNAVTHALSVPKDVGGSPMSSHLGRHDMRKEKEDLRRRAVTDNLLNMDVVSRVGDDLQGSQTDGDDEGLEEEDVEDGMSMTLQALALEMSGSFVKVNSKP